MSSSSNNNLQVAAISAAAGLAAGALVALVVWRYVASESHHEDGSTSQKKSLRSGSTGTNSAVPLFDSVQVMTVAQCCGSALSEAATARPPSVAGSLLFGSLTSTSASGNALVDLAVLEQS